MGSVNETKFSTLSKISHISKNSCIIKILSFTGIRQPTDNITKSSQCQKLQSKLFHPFPIFLHFAMIYTISALLFTTKLSFLSGTKSRYFSVTTAVLSVILWYAVYFRRSKIHSLLKINAFNTEHQNYNKHSTFCRISDYKAIFCLISINFLTAVIMPVFLVISNVSATLECNAFLFGFKARGIHNLHFFIVLFFYFAEFIIFPNIFMILYCFLTFRLARYLEEIKRRMKLLNTSYDSVLYRCYIHKILLQRINVFEKTFSLPIFLQICLLMTLSFTGLALEVEITRYNFYHVIEGILCMYSSITGIISIIYVASNVHHQLHEIKQSNRKLYEYAVIYEENSETKSEKKSLAILKVISERPVVYLTAWGIFRLDKRLLFSAFGTMITYGFLLIQLKDK